MLTFKIFSWGYRWFLVIDIPSVLPTSKTGYGKKLKCWKDKLLSVAGKDVLIKMVRQFLPDLYNEFFSAAQDVLR